MRKAKRAVFVVILLITLMNHTNAVADTALRVSIDGNIVQMDLEEYLIGVVAAEMPAFYPLEALKAQAVAARTRAVSSRCPRYEDADICAESTCCQGFLDESERLEKWGEDAGIMTEKILEAVQSTRSVVMLYDGEPIEVLYHAVSGGYTEDVEEVFSNSLPYLRGIASPGEEDSKNYMTEQVFTKQEIIAAFPDAVENGKIQLEILERSESGRVTQIKVGRFTMSGRLFRSALLLKSTNFELSMRDDQIVITQKGYGHGVGMSQAGASAMAREGFGYEAILTHYYTGITLGRIDAK